MTNSATWVLKDDLKIAEWTDKSIEIINSKFSNTLSLQKPADNLGQFDVILSRESPSIDGINLLEDNYIKDNYNTYIFDTYNSKLIFINSKVDLNRRKCLVNNLENSKAIDSYYGKYRNRSIVPQGILGYFPFNEKLIYPAIESKTKLRFLMRPSKEDNKLYNIIKELSQNCHIELELDITNNGEYYTRILKHDYDLAVGTISNLYNDPRFIFSFFHPNSKMNLVGDIAEIDQLMRNLLTSTTKEQVIFNANEIERCLFKNAVVYPLATLPTYSFTRKPLKIKSEVIFDIIKWDDFYE